MIAEFGDRPEQIMSIVRSIVLASTMLADQVIEGEAECAFYQDGQVSERAARSSTAVTCGAGQVEQGDDGERAVVHACQPRG